MMDALSPEIRFERFAPTPVDPLDWGEIEDLGLMHHRPSGLTFEVSLDEAALNARRASVTDFYANLVHVREGRPIPSGEELTELGRAAIVTFMAAIGFPIEGLVASLAGVPADEEYDRVFGILTEAVQRFPKAGISRLGTLPPMVDLVVGVGLIVGGEPAVKAMMTRMKERIADWKKGRFPTDDPSLNPAVPGQRRDRRRRAAAEPA